MIEIEKYNIEKLSRLADKEHTKSYGEESLIDLDKILNTKEKDNYLILSSKLDDYLCLFDEGIKTIIRIHESCKQNHSETQKGFSFVVLTSKLVTLLIGIRKLIYSGLVDSSKNLQRPFIETIDILYACLINTELSQKFANMKEEYDYNAFYWKNFSKDKLKKEYTKLFKKIEVTQDKVEYMSERRREQRSFLSESIHVSFRSSLANYLMFDIDFQIDTGYYGKITTAYPNLLVQLIEEINLINQIFFRSVNMKTTPELEGLIIDQLTKHYNCKFLLLYDMHIKQMSDKANEFPQLLKELKDEIDKTMHNNGS